MVEQKLGVHKPGQAHQVVSEMGLQLADAGRLQSHNMISLGKCGDHGVIT